MIPQMKLPKSQLTNITDMNVATWGVFKARFFFHKISGHTFLWKIKRKKSMLSILVVFSTVWLMTFHCNYQMCF